VPSPFTFNVVPGPRIDGANAPPSVPLRNITVLI
jgi:hypothetical protein